VTYSIVGRDPDTGQLGVAVQSRAFGTGAVCPWALPGVGAATTQSFTEISYGPRGLELLAAGCSPQQALDELTAADERRDFRQIAYVATDGTAAAYTGAACIPACGHIARENVSVQGNMLASEDVWPAMLDAFEASSGKPLAARLVDALDAAESAGGDFRGAQAAGLIVVSGNRDDPPWQRIVDVRIDDHADPVRELRRLYVLSDAYGRRRELSPDEARAAGMRDDEVLMLEDIDAYAALSPGHAAAVDRLRRLGRIP
jgi:uncharacterized Ntn-hydrolase superfamily protein